MPERIASRPGTEQITDPTGSGPFRFLQDEWVVRRALRLCTLRRLRPRQEPPAFFAGGKIANFERVEWIVQPDPATAAAALQKNEVDWVEQPLIDLFPMLNKSPGIDVKVVDPGGWLMLMAINHLNPPFDNLKVRQAILLALDQQAFADAGVGDQKELAIVPTGLFAPTMPMANTAGLEHLTSAA